MKILLRASDFKVKLRYSLCLSLSISILPISTTSFGNNESFPRSEVHTTSELAPLNRPSVVKVVVCSIGMGVGVALISQIFARVTGTYKPRRKSKEEIRKSLPILRNPRPSELQEIEMEVRQNPGPFPIPGSANSGNLASSGILGIPSSMESSVVAESPLPAGPGPESPFGISGLGIADYPGFEGLQTPNGYGPSVFPSTHGISGIGIAPSEAAASGFSSPMQSSPGPIEPGELLPSLPPSPNHSQQ